MAVFYRKYRPQKFSDLVGQDNVCETLLAQLSSGKISHGYLFWGPRGTGKTSTARIFAKAVNCQATGGKVEKGAKGIEVKFGEPCNKCQSCLSISDGSNLDLIEIDAASNRGIDEIRDLREKIKLSPVSSRFKVYIIDEAHMLTTEAFNALLKTLEEPPAHAIFILCTTSANKLPATIISRLTRVPFSRAVDRDIASALKKIVKAEGLAVDDGAFLEIAKIADGSYRDAVSLLDQLGSKGTKITADDVFKLGGPSGWQELFEFAQILTDRDLAQGVKFVEKLGENDVDIPLFIKDSVELFEKLLVLETVGEGEILTGLDKKQKEDTLKLASDLSLGQIQNIMKLLLIAESEIKIYPLPKIPLLLAVCKICPEKQESETEETRDENRREAVAVSVAVAPDVKGEAKIEEVKPELKKRVQAGDPADEVFPISRGKGKIKSLSEIEKNWNLFLDKVKAVNVHLSAALRNTRPVGIADDIVTIEVFYRFHKDKFEEPKVYKMLLDFMNEIYLTNVGLKFMLAERKSKTVPPAVVKSDLVDVSGEDLSAIAQEIFSK